MGPSVKFVSPNKGLISKKKMGVNFFPGKMTKPGEGGLAKDHTFSHFFLNLFFILTGHKLLYSLEIFRTWKYSGPGNFQGVATANPPGYFQVLEISRGGPLEISRGANI